MCVCVCVCVRVRANALRVHVRACVCACASLCAYLPAYKPGCVGAGMCVCSDAMLCCATGFVSAPAPSLGFPVIPGSEDDAPDNTLDLLVLHFSLSAALEQAAQNSGTSAQAGRGSSLLANKDAEREVKDLHAQGRGEGRPVQEIAGEPRDDVVQSARAALMWLDSLVMNLNRWGPPW